MSSVDDALENVVWAAADEFLSENLDEILDEVFERVYEEDTDDLEGIVEEVVSEWLSRSYVYDQIQTYIDEQIDDEIDQRAGRTDRGQRRVAVSSKPPNHDDIRRIEEQLQDAGEHQRQGKPKQLARQRAVAHINFVAI